MIVDVHTHFLRAKTDFGPQVHADMARCGINVKRWDFSPTEHLNATEPADAAVVFGLRAAATGWNVPNDAVAEHVARRRAA